MIKPLATFVSVSICVWRWKDPTGESGAVEEGSIVPCIMELVWSESSHWWEDTQWGLHSDQNWDGENSHLSVKIFSVQRFTLDRGGKLKCCLQKERSVVAKCCDVNADISFACNMDQQRLNSGQLYWKDMFFCEEICIANCYDFYL